MDSRTVASASLIPRARQPIDRMLAFTAALKSGHPAADL